MRSEETTFNTNNIKGVEIIKGSKNLKESRLPTLSEAIIIILIAIAILIGGFSIGAGGVQATLFPLLLSIGAVAASGIYLGYSWKSVQGGIVKAVSDVIVAVLILLLIGAIISLWIASGTIPTLIYFGLKLVSPSFFLGTAFILTALMATATGTSWGTIGSAGVAMMGIAAGLGISPAITAGAVISGALFGDKMSPLSDTTNMASAITKVDLFKHIRSMMWTTIPAALIIVIIFSFIGFNASDTADIGQIDEMISGLTKGWNISVFHLLPILIMFLGRKIPSLITLYISLLVGAIWALLFQGSSLSDVFVIATQGFVSQTGIEMVDNVLNAGGISTMRDIVVLILGATALGGALNHIGVLKVLVDSLVSKVKSTGGLVSSVLGSSYIFAFLSGNQALPIVLPGIAFQPEFDKRGIDRSVLSRSLEDAGTIVVPLVPWGAMTGFITATLGVGFTEYWPFLWLTFLVPIIALIYALTGIAIWKNPEHIKTDIEKE